MAKKIFTSKPSYESSLTPNKENLQPNRELFKHEILTFIFWNNFGLPGSGFPIWIRIRIQCPIWIPDPKHYRYLPDTKIIHLEKAG